MQLDATARFDDPDLLAWLASADDRALDGLPFGVIGFDTQGVVCRYNRFECEAAGLGMARVLGLPLFSVVAQCMNNFLVAQRFEDAAAQGLPLDTTLDYVLTLRMRPTAVRLRLLSAPGDGTRFVLVDRHG